MTTNQAYVGRRRGPVSEVGGEIIRVCMPIREVFAGSNWERALGGSGVELSWQSTSTTVGWFQFVLPVPVFDDPNETHEYEIVGAHIWTQALSSGTQGTVQIYAPSTTELFNFGTGTSTSLHVANGTPLDPGIIATRASYTAKLTPGNVSCRWFSLEIDLRHRVTWTT